MSHSICNISPLRGFLLCGFLFLLAACGGGGGGDTVLSTTVEASGAAAVPGPSYYAQVRPIVDAKCVNCHRTDGPAPVPLEEFSQLQSYQSALAYAVESGRMPPEGNLPLTAAEKDLLLDWLGNEELLEGEPADAPLSKYTWWGDVRPIVEERCSLCHVEGGLAPFPLQSYEDIVAIRAAAEHSVVHGTMPPWNPSNGYTRLQHNLSLTREEKAVLLDWLAGGVPRGNEEHAVNSPAASLEEVDWELSLRMPYAYTPTVYPDEYRCFVLDWPKEERRYITASSFLPQVPAEIHHVFVTIIPPGDVEAYKAAEQLDDKPGYTCFGDTRIPGELPTSPPADVLGWGPGINSKRLPPGTGILIEPGSALALQIHFNTLTTEPKPEQSELVFVTEPEVERPGATGYVLDISNWVFGENMLIPAGEDDVGFQYTMPVSELKGIFSRPELGVGPDDPIAIQRSSLHMHTLGKSSRLTLVRADGTEQIILDARNWDFDWQNKYVLEEEIIVQSEDSIRTQCVYDNTPDNQPVVNGEALPVRDVRWGDGTTDEMCASTLFFTRVDEHRHHQPTVFISRPAVLETFAPGDLLPVELRLNNFVLEQPMAHDHMDGGHGDMAMPNRGHYHLYLDNDDDSVEHVTDWRQQPVIRLPEDIAPGEHRLRVSLRASDHTALGVEDEIVFRVAAKPVAVQGVSLVNHQDWVPVAAADDPLAAHQPGVVDCPVSAWGLENGALEVETGVCNYLSLAQPSLVGVAKGDSLRLVLWHQQLRYEEPARAHVALALAGEVLWQETVAIPNDGGFYDVELTAPADIPEGSTVNFHLHNHGYNSWTLLAVEHMPAD